MASSKLDALRAVHSHVVAILDDANPAYLNRTINRFVEEVKITEVDALSRVVLSVLIAHEQTMEVRDDMYDALQKPQNELGAETCADLLVGLAKVAPTFTSEEGRPMNLRNILLDAVQHVFEGRIAKAACEKYAYHTATLVAFVGHLVARKLIQTPVILEVVKSVLTHQEQPAETLVVAVAKLLNHVGPLLDSDERGQKRLSKCLDALQKVAASKSQALEPVYSAATCDAVTSVVLARSQKWPAKCEVQVVVQYDIVSDDEALDIWTSMKEEKTLAVEQMHFTAAEITAESVKTVRITSMISGQTMGLFLSHSEDPCKEEEFRAKVAGALSIHQDRLAIFRPDGPFLDTTA